MKFVPRPSARLLGPCGGQGRTTNTNPTVLKEKKNNTANKIERPIKASFQRRDEPQTDPPLQCGSEVLRRAAQNIDIHRKFDNFLGGISLSYEKFPDILCIPHSYYIVLNILMQRISRID